MTDYLQRVRSHDRYNRLDTSNQLARTRAKREVEREIAAEATDLETGRGNNP